MRRCGQVSEKIIYGEYTLVEVSALFHSEGIWVLVQYLTGRETENIGSADNHLILSRLVIENILSDLDLKELSCFMPHLTKFI